MKNRGAWGWNSRHRQERINRAKGGGGGGEVWGRGECGRGRAEGGRQIRQDIITSFQHLRQTRNNHTGTREGNREEGRKALTHYTDLCGAAWVILQCLLKHYGQEGSCCKAPNGDLNSTPYALSDLTGGWGELSQEDMQRR